MCKKGDLIIDMDSRSSDALALALRFDCPIFINKDLLDKVSIEENKDSNQTIQEFEEELEEELNDLEKTSIDQIEEEKKDFSKKTVTELSKMLNRALKNEDYELAANLRDEISRRK